MFLFSQKLKKQKYAFLHFTSGSVNHSLEASSTCFLNFDQEWMPWSTVGHLVIQEWSHFGRKRKPSSQVAMLWSQKQRSKTWMWSPLLNNTTRSVYCCTCLFVGMMLRSTQWANDKFKDLLDGQLTATKYTWSPIFSTDIFQICEAKQNSGKTIWIGINSEVNQNEWKISGIERIRHRVVILVMPLWFRSCLARWQFLSCQFDIDPDWLGGNFSHATLTLILFG